MRVARGSAKGYFAGAVDGYKQTLAAFPGLDFGEIDVQVVDETKLRFFFRRVLSPPAQRPAFDAVALKAAVRRRARERQN